MNHDTYDDGYIRTILRSVRSIAIVGASPNTVRPSYFLFKYMLERGYDVIPVNPGQAGKQMLGKTFVARLSEIGRPVDMVDIFRASEHVMPVVDEALSLIPAAARDLDAAWRAQRRSGREDRGRRPQGGDEPLPEDRIRPAVLGDLLDGRELAHAELQARARSGEGRAAAVARPTVVRRRQYRRRRPRRARCTKRLTSPRPEVLR